MDTRRGHAKGTATLVLSLSSFFLSSFFLFFHLASHFVSSGRCLHLSAISVTFSPLV